MYLTSSPFLAEHAWLLLSLLLLAFLRPPTEAATVPSDKHRTSRRAATPRCACPGCEGNPLTMAVRISDAQAVEVFRARLRDQDKSPDTIDVYTAAVATWLRHLRRSGRKWPSAGVDQLRRWLDLPAAKRNPPPKGARPVSAQPEYLSPAAKALYSVAITRFNQELLRAGVLTVNRLAGWVPLRQPRSRPRTISREAIREVIDQAAGRCWCDIRPACGHRADRRLWAMIWTGYRGALRSVEIARARVEDVYLEFGEMDVRGKGGKGEVTRRIPLHPELWEVLTEYLEGLPAGPLFPSRGISPGRHLHRQSVRKILRDVLAPYGETGHILRYLMTQETQVAGRDIHATMGLTGHTDSRTLLIYTGAATEDTRRAVDAVPGLDKDFSVVAVRRPTGGPSGRVLGSSHAGQRLTAPSGPRVHRRGGGAADRTGD